MRAVGSVEHVEGCEAGQKILGIDGGWLAAAHATLLLTPCAANEL